MMLMRIVCSVHACESVCVCDCVFTIRNILMKINLIVGGGSVALPLCAECRN